MPSCFERTLRARLAPVLVAGTLAIVLAVLAVTLALATTPPPAVILAALVAATALVLLTLVGVSLAAQPQRLEVSSTGLTITGFGRSSALSWADVESVYVDGAAIVATPVPGSTQAPFLGAGTPWRRPRPGTAVLLPLAGWSCAAGVLVGAVRGHAGLRWRHD